MTTDLLLLSYIAMLFLQTIHIFEEIGSQAYELAGSLKKYLLVASVLVLIGYLGLVLLLLGVRLGYFVAGFNALVALGNGFVHPIGYVRTRSTRGTLGAGVFTGVPLGIVGGLVLVQLVSLIL